MLLAVWICQRIVAYADTSEDVIRSAVGSVERDKFVRPAHHAGLLLAYLAVATGWMAIMIFWKFNGRQVTVFGRLADFSIFISLVATTLLAFCMLVGAFTAAARIGYLCDLVKRFLRVHHRVDADRAKGVHQQPLLWNVLSEERARFVATPVMANRWTGRDAMATSQSSPTRWGADFAALLRNPPIDEDGLRALYALLTSEMANYQFAILGVTVATIASSGIVYLFPVSRATELIALNLLALLVAGVYSAYKTLQFEGDIVLSNVLCNRSQKKKWSFSLFIFIVIPFLVLAILLGLQQIPQVMTVGNGVLDALLKWVKPGG
jgi:hypothetical protein